MDGDMIKHERWMNRKQASVAAFSYEDQYHESWEERAFAEDAARGIGGFIWPPRSYACSFCRREFKSAQALGGHMNVHRRDRARLKQTLTATPTSAQTTAHAELKTFAEDLTVRTEEDKGRVSTKLCMGLSLDEFNKCKRLKSTGNFIFAEKQCLVVQPSSSLLRHRQGGLADYSQMSFLEELDLELRLGV